MNRNKFLQAAGLVIILMFVLGAVAPSAANTEEKRAINHVFLISVGGLNQEAFINNYMLNLRYLMQDGTAGDKTLAVRTDTMEAAEATLLTGSLLEQHQHYTVNDAVDTASILDICKKHGRSLLVIDGSGGRLNTFAYGDKEYKKKEAGASSQEVFEEAIMSFDQHKPFFSYIYIDDGTEALLRLDQAGYYKVIRNFDAQLGNFVQHLKESGVYSHSLIIVTSARSSSPSNLVPLAVCGPGVKVNATMSGAMVIDVASTICQLTGLPAPATSRGFPLYGSFTVAEDELQSFNSSWITALQKDRQANWDMNYQLEDELNRTNRLMDSIKEEKQSIFDFAGEREQNLNSLRVKMIRERVGWIGLVVLLLAGYAVQHRYLKRKFLLFK